MKLLQFDLKDTGLGGWGSWMSAFLFWKVYEGVFIPLQASYKGSYLLDLNELVSDADIFQWSSVVTASELKHFANTVYILLIPIFSRKKIIQTLVMLATIEQRSSH